jgi:small subunit ribosomal protein S16
MAVHIRLQRKGTLNRSFFHLVAADHRARRDGNFIEKLGYYDPNPGQSTMHINQERLQHWFERGAQLSDAVKSIVKAQKIKLSRKKA